MPSARSLALWVRTVDRLLTQELDAALAAEGVSRREWRALSRLTADPDAPARGARLHHLAVRGWVSRASGAWQLTTEGAAVKERADRAAAGIRATVTDAVAPDAFDATMTSLEAMARSLGWEDGMPLPRGRGHGHGHGAGRRHHGRDRHHGHHRRHDDRPHRAEHAGQDQCDCRHPQ